MADLARRFEVPEAFVEEYLRANFPDLDPVQEDSEAWLTTLSPTANLYTSYALSTNQRAKTVAEQLQPYLTEPPKRHLDIGCGYGGLLRGFSSGSTESVGIEVVEQLATYSRINTQDIEANIINRSIDDVDVDEIGSFDLITCTEVIEHVPNPQNLIRKMSEALRENGLLYLRMPNGRSIDFVREDGHFLLFGICLLSRQEAKEYKKEITGVDDDYNHMGEYYSLDYYKNALFATGIDPITSEESLSEEELMQGVAEKSELLAQGYRKWLSESGVVSYFIRQRIVSAYAAYQRDFFASYYESLTGGSATPSDFMSEFITPFWTVIGKKK